MQVPLQIAFRNLSHSDAVASRIRERVAWLERFYRGVISCRVTVEIPHRHHQRGNLFQVRIDLRVPGEELVISRKPDLHEAYKDIQVTLRDAFDEARREIEDYIRRRRRNVKKLGSPMHAIVARLAPGDDGYGFLRAEDGHEVYFHRNSVLHGKYDELRPGAEVRFSEARGDDGPQATTVELVGKQGRHFPRYLAYPNLNLS